MNVGYDPVNGARPLRRAVQRHMENPLAARILAGEVVPGDTVHVSVSEDGAALAFSVAEPAAAAAAG